jgi:hypothetical protein
VIKKIVIGAVILTLLYFFILPWLGKIITFVLAIGAIILLLGMLQGGKSGNGGTPI